MCWELLTMIDRTVGLLQFVSEPWYGFWEEIKRGC
jgi:hypothetical protein